MPAKLTQEEFLSRCRDVHGDMYDYTKTVYQGQKIPIIITCSLHGDFTTMSDVHLRKGHCNQCARHKSANLNRSRHRNTFLQRCQEVHGSKYDYTSTIYTGARNSISILCRTHGEFVQTAAMHLYGQGCPNCKSSHGETMIKAYLTKHKIRFNQQYKIKECKLKRRLSFDFFLPDYNTVIEFHGPQHYKFDSWFHGNYSRFQLQQLRDNTKRMFCEKNSINYIEINNENKHNLHTILFQVHRAKIVSEQTKLKISKARLNKTPTHIIYPPLEQLVQLVVTNSIYAIAEKLGVRHSSLKAYLRRRGITIPDARYKQNK